MKRNPRRGCNPAQTATRCGRRRLNEAQPPKELQPGERTDSPIRVSLSLNEAQPPKGLQRVTAPFMRSARCLNEAQPPKGLQPSHATQIRGV